MMSPRYESRTDAASRRLSGLQILTQHLDLFGRVGVLWIEEQGLFEEFKRSLSHPVTQTTLALLVSRFSNFGSNVP